MVVAVAAAEVSEILASAEIVAATQRWICDTIHCVRTKAATNGAIVNNWIHHIIIFRILTVNWTIIALHSILYCWQTIRMITINYHGSIANAQALAHRAARIAQTCQVSVKPEHTLFSFKFFRKYVRCAYQYIEHHKSFRKYNSIVFNKSGYVFLLLVAAKRIKKKICCISSMLLWWL